VINNPDDQPIPRSILLGVVSADYLKSILDDESEERKNLLDMLQRISAVDIGKVVEFCEQAAQDVLALQHSGKLAGDDGSALVALSQGLNYGTAICFNRTASPGLRLAGVAKERFYVRLMAAAAAERCASIISSQHLSHADQVSGFDQLRALVRRLRTWMLRAEEPANQTDAIGRLEYQFWRMYLTLAIFELRVNKTLPAWEGLYISRRRNQFDTDLEPREIARGESGDRLLIVDAFM
jgi:hypothetical protein